jgi:DNA helicase-2/ATP-dependent DNA helicase PcrA
MLSEMLEGEAATIRDVAIFLRDRNLLALEERFDRVLRLVVEPGDGNADPAAGLQPSDGPVTTFLGCPAHELLPYQRYVSEGSPFATQQGVKGAQFDRVIVVMDEEESDYNLYDYEEFFGVKEVSAEDRKKMENGEDTGWNRTLRLLYVSCTRAKRGLVLAFFVEDPDAAVAHVLASGVLPKDAVLTRDVLEVG